MTYEEWEFIQDFYYSVGLLEEKRDVNSYFSADLLDEINDFDHQAVIDEANDWDESMLT
jgi:hypothetical protein